MFVQDPDVCLPDQMKANLAITTNAGLCIAYLLFYSIPLLSMNYQNYPKGHTKATVSFERLMGIDCLPDQMKANLTITSNAGQQ